MIRSETYIFLFAEETFHTTHSSSENNTTSNTNNSSSSNSNTSTNNKPSTNCIDAPSLSNGPETNSNHVDMTSSSSSNMFATAILDQISGSGFTQQLSQSQQQQQQLQNFTSSAISLNSSVHYSSTPSACVDNVIKPPSSAGATTSAVTCSSAASSALYSAAAATGSTAGRSCTVQPQNSPPISTCNVIGSNVSQSAINCLLMNGPVSPKVSSQIYNLPSLSGVVSIYFLKVLMLFSVLLVYAQVKCHSSPCVKNNQQSDSNFTKPNFSKKWVCKIPCNH